MTAPAPGIDPSAAPSGDGCAQCEAGDGPGWWSHLRRCAHRVEAYVDGPALAPPQARPSSQPAPGPAGRVPAGWQRQLHRSGMPARLRGFVDTSSM